MDWMKLRGNGHVRALKKNQQSVPVVSSPKSQSEQVQITYLKEPKFPIADDYKWTKNLDTYCPKFEWKDVLSWDISYDEEGNRFGSKCPDLQPVLGWKCPRFLKNWEAGTTISDNRGIFGRSKVPDPCLNVFIEVSLFFVFMKNDFFLKIECLKDCDVFCFLFF